MIKYHPDNMHIYFENISAFYVNPKYKLEVIHLLEEQVAAGRSGHGVYWNLALTCERGATPLADASPEGKARFLEYYSLPPGTEIPHEVDKELTEKAVGYFRKAISNSGSNNFYFAFYSEQLAGLLSKLGRYEEAAGVCRDALPRAEEISKPDLMVTYGSSLRRSGKAKEAKEVLNKVRRCDKEGFEKGPGHATHNAETILGLIAMDANDLKEAKKHLLASCKVQKCPHNITKGLRLDLAQKLLAAGESRAVATYCSAVLHDFTPDQKETLDLLHQAEEKQRR
jgi:predicted Zn-dependent protease